MPALCPGTEQARTPSSDDASQGRHGSRSSGTRTGLPAARRVGEPSQVRARSEPGTGSADGRTESQESSARLVEKLKQLVSRELHLLVTPLCGPVHAGDQAAAMDPAEVAVHKGVSGFRVVGSPCREAEVPLAVLLPRVLLQELVLGGGGGLNLSPVTIEDVLASCDGLTSPSNGAIVDGIRRHSPL